MRRFAARTTVSLMLSCFAVAAMAQSPPEPTSGADLFVPDVDGVVATDFCFHTGCYFGGPHLFLFEQARTLMPDAEGSLYYAAQQLLYVPLCNGYAMNKYMLMRVSASGQYQLVGEFLDRCEDGVYRSLRIAGLWIDSINGLLFAYVDVNSCA